MDVLTCPASGLIVQAGEMLSSLVLATSVATLAGCVSITDIQGPAFLSPLLGRTVTNITGVVTAKVSVFYNNADID